MHKKSKHTIPVGGQVVCGSRRLRLDEVDADSIAHVTLTVKEAETIEIRDPKQRDNPWILDDPGEGAMVDRAESVMVGHKIRVGNHRQFRILFFDGTTAEVVVIGPATEIDPSP